MVNMVNQSSSDNKIVYQLNLSNNNLGVINPYLFIEKFQEKLLLKLPNVKVKILQNTKSKNQHFLQLTCFCSDNIPDYQVNNLQEEIAFIAFTLRYDLLNRIEDAKRSVA
jgi:hypothetical protein